MKIELAHIAYRKLGLLYSSVEIGRDQYYAPSFKKRIADTLIRTCLHHGSPFAFLCIISIDPTLSDRYSVFVPDTKNWGTTVRVEQGYNCYEFYLRILFETNVYSVDDDWELRYVSVGVESHRLRFESRRRRSP